MVINHFLDPDVSDPRSVNASGLQLRHGKVCRLEDESVRTPEVEREVAGAIGQQGVAVARDAVHVRECRGRVERSESALEQLPLVGAPVLVALAVVGTDLLQFGV